MVRHSSFGDAPQNAIFTKTLSGGHSIALDPDAYFDSEDLVSFRETLLGSEVPVNTGSADYITKVVSLVH